jgi:hypothetical protein
MGTQTVAWRRGCTGGEATTRPGLGRQACHEIVFALARCPEHSFRWKAFFARGGKDDSGNHLSAFSGWIHDLVRGWRLVRSGRASIPAGRVATDSRDGQDCPGPATVVRRVGGGAAAKGVPDCRNGACRDAAATAKNQGAFAAKEVARGGTSAAQPQGRPFRERLASLRPTSSFRAGPVSGTGYSTRPVLPGRVLLLGAGSLNPALLHPRSYAAGEPTKVEPPHRANSLQQHAHPGMSSPGPRWKLQARTCSSGKGSPETRGVKSGTAGLLGPGDRLGTPPALPPRCCRRCVLVGLP